MRQPLSSSQGQFPSAATATDLAAIDEALHQRETTLHQRREAEELLGQFIRGQMTRHYWGTLRFFVDGSGNQFWFSATGTGGLYT